MTMNREDRFYYEQLWKRNKMGSKVAKFLIAFVVIAALFMLTGCKTQYVPVTEVHTEYKHTVDSVRQIDSIFHEKETVVMQLDSAAMAEYGIQLKNAERAWLVRSKEMEREIARLMAKKTDTVVKIDSVPKIVIKEKELSKFQQLKMDAGGAAIFIALALILLLIIKLAMKGKLF